jgi:hypothetical protein
MVKVALLLLLLPSRLSLLLLPLGPGPISCVPWLPSLLVVAAVTRRDVPRAPGSPTPVFVGGPAGGPAGGDLFPTTTFCGKLIFCLSNTTNV